MPCPFGSEEAALLGAAADAPDDDAPRLAYADWLDDHADPDRAEFVRLQCLLHRGDRVPRTARRRADRLFAAHRARWLAELPEIFGVTWGDAELACDFVRGFPYVVRTYGNATFPAHAETIFRHAPGCHVFFEGVTDWRPIAGSPHLARLTDLDLTGYRLGVVDMIARGGRPTSAACATWCCKTSVSTPAASRCCWARTNWTGIRSLDLLGNAIGSLGVHGLGRAWGGQLERLDVRENGIDDGGAASFADAGTWPALREVRLDGNPISRRVLRAVRTRPNFARDVLEIAAELGGARAVECDTARRTHPPTGPRHPRGHVP